jgi:hypothetical protein
LSDVVLKSRKGNSSPLTYAIAMQWIYVSFLQSQRGVFLRLVGDAVEVQEALGSTLQDAGYILRFAVSALVL